MNHDDDEKLHKLLKQNTLPANTELDRDLWPKMLRRLAERSAAVPWFDWMLLGLVALCLFLVPNTIPVLLYHL